MGKTIIIGGGAIGLSLAYHLARRGEDEVILLERNQLTSGTSWHAAGIVGPLRSSINMTRLAMHALSLLPNLEEETGLKTGFRVTGGYWLAREAARMDELHRIADIGRVVGLDSRIIGPGDINVAGLNREGLVGALQVEKDANVNPVDMCMAYASAARARGVKIRENMGVATVLVEGGVSKGVQLSDGGEILADKVAVCCGAWSKHLCESAGVALPLQAVEHMYLVTEPMNGLPDPYPVLRDLDRGIYVKGDVGKLVVGGFEPDAKPWDAFGTNGAVPFLELPEDWDQFAPFMDAALHLVPALQTTGIQHFMNGPESFTADTRPLIGETPEVEGLFVAAGMNSVGVMSSAGVGRLLADWMVEGAAPHDAWDVDISRVDPLTASQPHMHTRMKEAVSDAFALHWPFKQPNAGRNLRKSALHTSWEDCGAQFGLTAGWERGLWYATADDEKNLPYSVGRQNWQYIAVREAQAMAEGVALVDLTPFTKIDVKGPDAEPFLQNLATGDVGKFARKALYTQFLNPRGGIEADVTISKYGDNYFRITSGAATRWKDLAWLHRHRNGQAVEIIDVTENESVIGVMGPKSRALLESFSDIPWTAAPFGSVQTVTVADLAVTATRVSFVGELGWELSVNNASAPQLFAALRAGGAGVLGHFALDGCRIEKGFKHWGHDLGPDISPLEAGLGFAIDWTKGDFLGRRALEEQRQSGLNKRLVLFQVEGDPLILHDEPIRENESWVGLTTSGAFGPRIGQTLAFGTVKVKPGETLKETCTRRFQIDVAGKQWPAVALPTAPYDPQGKRMRP